MAAARRVCSWLVSSMLATSASAMLTGAGPPLPLPLPLLLLVEALSPWVLHAALDRMHLNHTIHRARIEQDGPNVHAWLVFFQSTRLHAMPIPFCPHLPRSPNRAMPMPGMATRGRAQADRLRFRLEIISPPHRM